MTRLPETLIFKSYKKYPDFSLQEAVAWSEGQINQWGIDFKEVEEFNKEVETYNDMIEKNWRGVFTGRIKNSKGSLLGWYKEFLSAIGKPHREYFTPLGDRSIQIGDKLYRGCYLLQKSDLQLIELIAAIKQKQADVSQEI